MHRGGRSGAVHDHGARGLRELLAEKASTKVDGVARLAKDRAGARMRVAHEELLVAMAALKQQVSCHSRSTAHHLHAWRPSMRA
jgi:hypothetical protein